MYKDVFSRMNHVSTLCIRVYGGDMVSQEEKNEETKIVNSRSLYLRIKL